MDANRIWVGLGLLAVFAALVAAVGIFLKKMFGLGCQFCENNKTTPWKKLSPKDQENLLRYFTDYEKRSPDTSAIFVCENCQTVFDDFSGEKKSMEPDKGLTGCLTWCKVCKGVVCNCDLDNDNIHCTSCNTPYAWRTHEGSGYRILMPPEDAEVLERCTGFTENL